MNFWDVLSKKKMVVQQGKEPVSEKSENIFCPQCNESLVPAAKGGSKWFVKLFCPRCEQSFSMDKQTKELTKSIIRA